MGGLLRVSLLQPVRRHLVHNRQDTGPEGLGLPVNGLNFDQHTWGWTSFDSRCFVSLKLPKAIGQVHPHR